MDNPDSINQFRLVTLYNVIYKVVTKILVNWLRPFLDNIISPHQVSFLPGSQTTDNIIMTQEIVHSLEKKKGKSGGMIFKIDLEKAYDKILWEFLQKVLEIFYFPPQWIKLIMSRVTQEETSILWNGGILPPIKSGRGLRQENSLSPYLFVLSLEYL